MPFLVKATHFFDGREHGWTESYWFNQDGNDLNDAYVIADRIAQKRSRLLGAPCVLKATRVHFETDNTGAPLLGDSVLNYVQYPGSTTTPAAEQDCALQVIWRNPLSTRRKLMFLRGVWDVIESDNGTYEPTNDWNKAFGQWRSALFAGNVGWYGRGAVFTATITTYTQLIGGQVSMVVDQDFFTASGVPPRFLRVQCGISGFTSSGTQLNGVKVLLPQSATTAITLDRIAVLPQTVSGKITKWNKQFYQAGTILDQKIITRRVGAPLLVSHGRSRRRPRT